MMLWLLATLSGVTPLGGIAHRLKAGSSGPLHPRAVLVSPRTREPLRAPTPKNDPPTLERGTIP